MFNLYYDSFNGGHFVEEDGFYEIQHPAISYVRDFETKEVAEEYARLLDVIVDYMDYTHGAVFFMNVNLLASNSIAPKDLKSLGFSGNYELLHTYQKMYFFKLTKDEILLIDLIKNKSFILMA